jgi:hypothetical protein
LNSVTYAPKTSYCHPSHGGADLGCLALAELQIGRKALIANEKQLVAKIFATSCFSFEVGATGFEPTTSRTRSKRSFLAYCTLVEELNVARRCEAQTTPSRRRSALIDEAERSSAPFALKIGGESGIGRYSGSSVGELQHGLTQSCSDTDGLNCYW